MLYKQPLAGQFGTDVVPQDMSLGCSAGIGLAEHGVKEIKDKGRSLARAISVLLKVTLDPKHPVVAWLAQWAATTINIARKGPDGRTAGRFCRVFERPITQIGVKEHHTPKGKRDSRFSSRFLLGVLLGMAFQSNNILVCLEGGVVAGGSIFSEVARSSAQGPKVPLESSRGYLSAQWW